MDAIDLAVPDIVSAEVETAATAAVYMNKRAYLQLAGLNCDAMVPPHVQVT